MPGGTSKMETFMKQQRFMRPPYPLPHHQKQRSLSDLGYLYHQLGQLKKAVRVYGRSLQQYPQSATTLLLRGTALLEQKRYQEALKDFNEAIRLSPYLDNAYWGRGQVFMALEDYSWAVASFTKAIDLNPDEPDYYASRALGYKAMGADGEEKRGFGTVETLER